MQLLWAGSPLWLGLPLSQNGDNQLPRATQHNMILCALEQQNELPRMRELRFKAKMATEQAEIYATSQCSGPASLESSVRVD